MHASKAMRILACENKAVASIIERHPELKSLASMLGGMSPSPFTALQGGDTAPVPVHLATSSRFDLLQQISMKGVIPAGPRKAKKGVGYPCGYPGCDKVSASWSGSDGHMRSEHSKMAYGPCVGCGKCHFNRDSFRRHRKACLKKKGMKVPERGEELPEKKVDVGEELLVEAEEAEAEGEEKEEEGPSQKKPKLK